MLQEGGVDIHLFASSAFVIAQTTRTARDTLHSLLCAKVFAPTFFIFHFAPLLMYTFLLFWKIYAQQISIISICEKYRENRKIEELETRAS
jgi:hypothetical protein